MRILILGGTGFIGPEVVRGLHELGHEIACFHRGRSETPLPASVRHIHGERARLESFADDFRRFRPDVVLDMRSLCEADARRTTGVMTGIAKRVVAISSGDVYRIYGVLHGCQEGPVDNAPVTEDSPLRTRLHPYRGETPRAADDPLKWMDDYDKIPAEKAFLSQEDLPATVLRLPMVYGPGDRQHRLFPYLKRMMDARPAVLMAESLAKWRGTRGYVGDVAAAIGAAVVDERAAGRIYNVAEPDPLSESEWVQAVGRAVGWKGRVVTLPDEALPPDLRPGFNAAQHLVIDSSRIRRELGFVERISRDEALQRAAEWEREHPPAGIDPSRFDYAAEDAILNKRSRPDAS